MTDSLTDETQGNAENDAADVTSLALFEGDTSTLYPEQRWCLHALLKQRYVSADRYPEQWAVLLDNPDIIESRLNELFFRLRLDRENQVAFKYPAVADTGESLPSLLRDMPHTKEETIVMVFVRQRFFAQRQEGEDMVFVDRQVLLDEVADQRPEHATHRAMDDKRARKAIDGLAAAGVLLKTQDPDRFRISPIIEVLLPIEKLRSLWTWLMTRNGTEAEDGNAEATNETDNDDELDLLAELEEQDA
ncbi:DUF4194 domain-containing protein [Cellulosimicrobium cellulans]|uniref:DUF4194 domain-containing protein n=1 Tax=Cellulosimicrobium cellulans TaxID=1710 RepID=UPI0018847297|nr:DUF4194 domain-containing protein [Cellulosimicrobium cellulans]MBE9937653.1 DUF4194 domain-containing protein [Cellulosimicrobium cellulans]